MRLAVAATARSPTGAPTPRASGKFRRRDALLTAGLFACASPRRARAEGFLPLDVYLERLEECRRALDAVATELETREDLTAHSKQPHLLAWRDASAPHLVERRIEIVHPERIEQF